MLKLITFLMLSGCSQKFEDTFSTINTSINGYLDVDLSDSQLEKLQYDSVYVKINNGKQILMILALIENNKETGQEQLKWVSADKVMLITENGRIVKTLGLNHNLVDLRKENSSLASPPNTLRENSFIYSWMPDYRYNFRAISHISHIKNEILHLSDWSVSTQYTIESIKFDSFKNHSFENRYWRNEANRTVKTIQYIGPNMDKIEMHFIKRFVESKS
ncbi:putative regulator [Marinomonas sp. MED121]|uniref:YjbF family lipoprotein n=1 Tax=Marinomonas sp. MED121 TaxID=314277 RepID=UPI0000690F7B|nr:YjbF family lipoprotein [Marinomonas sp. MED121]EAQ67260.1 putative regulator [Marinomonas sp. MED121]